MKYKVLYDDNKIELRDVPGWNIPGWSIFILLDKEINSRKRPTVYNYQEVLVGKSTPDNDNDTPVYLSGRELEYVENILKNGTLSTLAKLTGEATVTANFDYKQFNSFLKL